MVPLLYGFGVILSGTNLLYCFLGVLLGTLVGLLPGLGPAAAISLLLPTTFALEPTAALIMLAGIYYGAMYGGSTTSILVNVPGEAASVVTCLDGYELARKGRAGPALGMAAFASFIAGTLGVVALTFVAPPMARFALRFGPPEYFLLLLLGLSLVLHLSGGSMLKAGLMAAMGLSLGTIGLDPMTGAQRFTFGSITLLDGIGLVPVAMGLFGVGEILTNLVDPPRMERVETRLRSLLPTRQDWRDSRGPLARGSILGFLVGVLPGGGAVVASFLTYALERRLSKHPEAFGKGVIEGVAAPEAANNAAATGAFVPLLTMGIPANAVIALMLGALLIQGVTPGPLLMAQHPQLFWGVIASMYVGNIMLLVLNLPLVGLFVQLLKVPYPLLATIVVLSSAIGAYSLNNNPYDVLIMMAMGILGYLCRRSGFEPAPLVLGLVLGPLMEVALRQGLLIMEGELLGFIRRPISFVLLLMVGFVVCSGLARIAWARRKRLDTAGM